MDLVKEQKLIELYNQYVKEICDLKDISRWVSKKTVTSKVLNPERANEQNVLDAIDEDEVQEGDKVYLFFTKDGKLKQQDQWNSDHDVDRLLEKLHKTILTFSTILDKEKFPNYKLKKNKKALEELCKHSK